MIIATMLGYDAVRGSDQTLKVAVNMRYMVAGGYLLGAVLMLVGVLFIYNLDKKTLSSVERELNKVRHGRKSRD